MPWARAARRAPSLAPQKSLAKPSASASALGSLQSGSDFDAALQEEEGANKEAARATAEAQLKDVGTSVSFTTFPYAQATGHVAYVFEARVYWHQCVHSSVVLLSNSQAAGEHKPNKT